MLFTHFKIVEQIPIIQNNRQPTVAIITAEYCEKVAVDILIENKETFVRYTTLGKNLKFNNLIYFNTSSRYNFGTELTKR